MVMFCTASSKISLKYLLIFCFFPHRRVVILLFLKGYTVRIYSTSVCVCVTPIQMDPSKRICIRNLPEACTKREIAEMIRNRTGAQPHSIDLGVDEEGRTRRYAHFSCEGAKNVLEALAAGCSLRGQPIEAIPAKVHFSFRYAQAKQKREREEAQEVEERQAFWESFRRRLEAKGCTGEISPQPKRLRSFYYEKQKYARVASEIAAKCRAAHASHHGVPQRHMHHSQAPPPSSSTTDTPETEAPHPAEKLPKRDTRKGEKGFPPKGKKARQEKSSGGGDTAPPPTPAEQPAEPSKAERKLSGLQAKLNLLKQKLAQKKG